jgi:2-keto-4-pentenoate hydratase/2-oxohepta-3-ene-1,7-dioic acid hydratase in catechol pathway
MKVVCYRYAQTRRYGVVEDDDVFDGGTSISAVTRGRRVGLLADLHTFAPIINPGKIIAVGLNYRKHAAEAGVEVPGQPILFSKFSTAIVGPGAPITLPELSEEVDLEAELAVVIGRECRGVKSAEALEYVFGYTCLNDVSARDIQRLDGQWTRAKSFDSFCPIGPWIVTSDEIPDPQALGIRSLLNGLVMQDAATSSMVFSVAELIAFAAEAITLMPGDIIATGTPDGVGVGRNPPVFLRPGDVVRVEIGGIGVLENPVVGGV